MFIAFATTPQFATADTALPCCRQQIVETRMVGIVLAVLKCEIGVFGFILRCQENHGVLLSARDNSNQHECIEIDMPPQMLLKIT
jgi:hypothetical protein